MPYFMNEILFWPLLCILLENDCTDFLLVYKPIITIQIIFLLYVLYVCSLLTILFT